MPQIQCIEASSGLELAPDAIQPPSRAIEFIQQFNDANAIGLNNIPAVVAENTYGPYDLTVYYTKNISYRLTPSKRQGLQRFLAYLQ